MNQEPFELNLKPDTFRASCPLATIMDHRRRWVIRCGWDGRVGRDAAVCSSTEVLGRIRDPSCGGRLPARLRTRAQRHKVRRASAYACAPSMPRKTRARETLHTHIRGTAWCRGKCSKHSVIRVPIQTMLIVFGTRRHHRGNNGMLPLGERSPHLFRSGRSCFSLDYQGTSRW
jgi:hypothetical protein